MKRMAKLKRLQDIYRFPRLVPRPEFAASSVTRGRWSSRSAAAEKNALRGLRARLSHLLRQTTTPQSATSLVATSVSILRSRFAGSIALGVAA